MNTLSKWLMHAWLSALMLAACAASASDIAGYRLSETALDQYERATEAMYRFARDNPQHASALDGDEDDIDIDNLIRKLDERVPGLRPAMEASGMKLEEYFTFAVSLATNAIGAAMIDQFGGNEAGLTELERENIDFVRRNMARIEAFDARLQKEYSDVAQASGEDEGRYGE